MVGDRKVNLADEVLAVLIHLCLRLLLQNIADKFSVSGSTIMNFHHLAATSSHRIMANVFLALMKSSCTVYAKAV